MADSVKVSEAWDSAYGQEGHRIEFYIDPTRFEDGDCPEIRIHHMGQTYVVEVSTEDGISVSERNGRRLSADLQDSGGYWIHDPATA
ncbi:MAG TPA: hypothetical protein VG269_17360 [Tepidisphaeraceae bacterium]|jgi:hypothetical protein|nr:hypothetical protein [Tepidisphaeraceae bacterium]